MQSRGKDRLRRLCAWGISALLLGTYASPPARQIRALPQQIYVCQGEEPQILFDLPAGVTLNRQSVQALGSMAQTLKDVGAGSVSVVPDRPGDTQVTLSLWGKIPVKTVTVRVYEEKSLVAVGGAIGLTLQMPGVLVVGLAGVNDGTRTLDSPAGQAGIRPGDLITAVGGTPVETVAQLETALSQSPLAATVTVRRNGRDQTLQVLPVRVGEAAKIGIWARQSTAGIGTMTFYDPQTGVFGALGHPITDPDTGTILPVEAGSVYEARVTGVQKGARGAPGQLEGAFGGSETLGTLDANTPYGVFGVLREAPSGTLYPVAARGEITVGPAQILTTIDGRQTEAFSCEIERLFSQNSVSTKSMVVRITDPRLLAATGGIVQGMSGSPILQNGKIVGAVTHVYVSDASRGYGIYIEWMLDAAQGQALLRPAA